MPIFQAFVAYESTGPERVTGGGKCMETLMIQAKKGIALEGKHWVLFLGGWLQETSTLDSLLYDVELCRFSGPWDGMRGSETAFLSVLHLLMLAPQ